MAHIGMITDYIGATLGSVPPFPTTHRSGLQLGDSGGGLLIGFGLRP